jgi:hypothetical protein
MSQCIPSTIIKKGGKKDKMLKSLDTTKEHGKDSIQKDGSSTSLNNKICTLKQCATIQACFLEIEGFLHMAVQYQGILSRLENLKAHSSQVWCPNNS